MKKHVPRGRRSGRRLLRRFRRQNTAGTAGNGISYTYVEGDYVPARGMDMNTDVDFDGSERQVVRTRSATSSTCSVRTTRSTTTTSSTST